MFDFPVDTHINKCSWEVGEGCLTQAPNSIFLSGFWHCLISHSKHEHLKRITVNALKEGEHYQSTRSHMVTSAKTFLCVYKYVKSLANLKQISEGDLIVA